MQRLGGRASPSVEEELLAPLVYIKYLIKVPAKFIIFLAAIIREKPERGAARVQTYGQKRRRGVGRHERGVR